MSKRSKILNLVICGVAFVVMMVCLFLVDDPDQLGKALQSAKPVYLVLALCCMLVYWLLESLNLHFVAREVNPKQKFKNSAIVSIIGQYFNCITPFASGGQPIQAYYLMKFGVPLGSSLTILLTKFIGYQATLTVYSAVILIFRFGYLMETNPILMPLVIIGFVVNSAVIAGLLMLAFFRKPSEKIAHFVVKLLGKLHIFKDVDSKLKYIDMEMKMYYENFRFIKKRPAMLAKLVLGSALQLTAFFGISYVIYLAFGLSGTDFLTIISCQAFVTMISAFVPLPGALGAAEGSYALFFMPIFGSDCIVLSTVIWRLLTFYLAIVVGMAVSLYMNKKSSYPRSGSEKLSGSKQSVAEDAENEF